MSLTKHHLLTTKERNKARAQKWRKIKQTTTRQAPPPAQAEPAIREDPPSDAPLYDMTPFSAGIPYNQEYAQNFDLSGYPTLCEETYNTLQGLNPILARDIPFPGLFHSMNTLLQTALIDSVYDDGP